MPDNLAPAISELLARRVNSFEKLEIVIALHDAPAQTLSINELSNSLKLSRDSVCAAATELHADSLAALTSQGKVQLLPPGTRDQTLVAELARLYREDRLAVVTTMLDIALSRIRKMTASSNIFANAFTFQPKTNARG